VIKRTVQPEEMIWVIGGDLKTIEAPLHAAEIAEIVLLED